MPTKPEPLRTSPLLQMRNLDKDGESYTVDIMTRNGREYLDCAVYAFEGEWIDIDIKPSAETPVQSGVRFIRWDAIESIAVNPG